MVRVGWCYRRAEQAFCCSFTRSIACPQRVSAAEEFQFALIQAGGSDAPELAPDTFAYAPMRHECERGREWERLRSHLRGQPTYGSSSRPTSRFASSENVGLSRTVSSLEGAYKRPYVSPTSRPHTSYLSHGRSLHPTSSL